MHTFYQCVQLQFTYNKQLIIQCLKLKDGHIFYTQEVAKRFQAFKQDPSLSNIEYRIRQE